MEKGGRNRRDSERQLLSHIFGLGRGGERPAMLILLDSVHFRDHGFLFAFSMTTWNSTPKSAGLSGALFMSGSQFRRGFVEAARQCVDLYQVPLSGKDSGSLDSHDYTSKVKPRRLTTTMLVDALDSGLAAQGAWVVSRPFCPT